MRTLFFAGMLFVASAGMCQTPPAEPDVLRTLLAEVHQLRTDIQAMTVASSRVQIALHALQLQDGTVARAAQRLDEARNKCAAGEARRQQVSVELQRLEQGLVSATIPEGELKDVQRRRTETRTFLEGQTAAVQVCQAAEAEVANQLRNEQAKLTELQDRITRLDKTLEQLGAPGK